MRIELSQVPIETGTTYPDAFVAAVQGRSRQRVGKAAGLTNFGVNLTTLQPGAQSALRHWHSSQDEFVYVVQGELILVTDEGEQRLQAGDMAGFPAGKANGHHLRNCSGAIAVYLEIGDHSQPDTAEYLDVDLRHDLSEKGASQFVYKDGRCY